MVTAYAFTYRADEMAWWIVNRGPMIVGTAWTSAMYRAYQIFLNIKAGMAKPISSHVTTTYSTVGNPPPRKAMGGIVSRATLAVVGESGPEAIIPLTNPSRAAEVLAASGLLGGDTIVNVFLDGKLIEKQVTRRQSERLRRLERAYA
jgi:hypothetical protein